MADQPDWVAKLKWKAKYLQEWLRRYQGAEDAAKSVEETLAFTKWEIQAIESRPAEAIEIILPDLSRTLDSDISYLPQALPLIAAYVPRDIAGTSAFTSTSASAVFNYAGRVGDLATPNAIDYSGQITASFVKLQHLYDRPARVKTLLATIASPSTLTRFDEALTTYLGFRRAAASRTAVATSMRNLVYGLKGDLWQAAREQPGENMTWATMAERLGRDGPQGPMAQQLEEQEEVHNSLVSRLSEVLKGREAGSLTNIDYLWAQVLDHLVSVLGLIDSRSDDQSSARSESAAPS